MILNNKQINILIFDSGVGGLSVFNKIRTVLPNFNYIYTFDNEFFPYGEKSEKYIINRVVSIFSTIINLYKIDLIIIACNTVSVISLKKLKKKFYPIIGITPAIKQSIKLTKKRIIALLATSITIKCNYINKMINKLSKDYCILSFGLNKLVNLAEIKVREGKISLSLLKEILLPILNLNHKPDVIILGCTHFSLLIKELRIILPKNIHLIDNNNNIAYRVFNFLKNKINIKEYKYKPNNKVICLSIDSKVIKLLPRLLKYGFKSLEVIKI